jgi:chaperone required for assembly of F1-ATPase
MRDILSDIFENQPLDPMESARKGARTPLRQRFYTLAHVGELAHAGEGEGGYPLLLDGKPVRTPARRLLAAPSAQLAERIAAEWNAQTGAIDPAQMPVTRLANAIVDGVAERRQAVVDEVVQYLGSDLLCYRAEAPAALIARQSQHWDPILDWARDALGARFFQIQGIVFSEQPPHAIAAARSTIPADPWRLGAVSSITTITGSALLALALAQNAVDGDSAWTAAQVDEDWQTEKWGSDSDALARRSARRAEFDAAVAVLRDTAAA